MKSTLFVCALGALTVCRAFAQDETRQAMITGKSGSPKCTIEVEVDAVADVEIRGTVGTDPHPGGLAFPLAPLRMQRADAHESRRFSF